MDTSHVTRHTSPVIVTCHSHRSHCTRPPSASSLWTRHRSRFTATRAHAHPARDACGQITSHRSVIRHRPQSQVTRAHCTGRSQPHVTATCHSHRRHRGAYYIGSQDGSHLYSVGTSRRTTSYTRVLHRVIRQRPPICGHMCVVQLPRQRLRHTAPRAPGRQYSGWTHCDAVLGH